MTHVGIDLEQFVRDPQSSGIQRVLQQLARHWPTETVKADFVVPYEHEFILLTPPQAYELISTVFTAEGQQDPRGSVDRKLAEFVGRAPQVDLGRLLAVFGSWLLPEVSYLPSVLARFRLIQKVMPTCMIGFDVLPMSEPGNYRFIPGTSGHVSEYFRLLATCDAVVCISDFSREEIWHRLRRERALPTTVAHPGGDHVFGFSNEKTSARSKSEPVKFLRLGTLESRKRPVELIQAFSHARQAGARANLVFIGAASSSDATINETVQRAALAGIGIEWIEFASDEEVLREIASSDVFLSVGIEGYGIPVLEAIALNTPVLFDGIQPAAEVMRGFGAVPFIDHAEDRETWTDAFNFFADPANAAELRATIDRQRIPRWSEFADAIAQAALRTE